MHRSVKWSPLWDGKDSASGDAAGKTDDKKADDKTPAPSAATEEQVASLVNAVAQVTETVKGLETKFDERKEPEPSAAKKDDTPKDDEPIELWGNKKIMENVKGMIENAVKGVDDKVSSTQTEVIKEKLKAEVGVARKNHEDFDKWDKEMQGIIKDAPGLSVERYYQLARLDNPEKAKKIDDEKAKAEEGDEDRSQSSYGGMTPTSGTTTRNARMSKEDAAQAAWEEVFGSSKTA